VIVWIERWQKAANLAAWSSHLWVYWIIIDITFLLKKNAQ